MKIARLSAALALFVWLMSLHVQASAQMPIPPPTEQSTADCARPVFASDQLVCADPEIREIDLQLADALRQNVSLPATDFVENDSQWFKRRSLCAFSADHRSCLIGAYQDRVSIIESATMTPVRFFAAKCKSRGRVLLGMLSNGQMLIRSTNTKALIAISSIPIDRSPWIPMVTFTKRGRVFDFTSHNGQKLLCKVTS